jgi:hypothetical protein
MFEIKITEFNLIYSLLCDNHLFGKSHSEKMDKVWVESHIK